MIQMNLFKKQKQTHRNRNKLMITTGEGVGGGINEQFEISRYTLLYTKYINNKVPLSSTGNYIQYPVIHHNGKEYEKE